MQARGLARRLLSPAGFVAVAVCFLLPFVTVSCSSPHGETVTSSYTGTDLVSGGKADLAYNDQLQSELQPSPPPANGNQIAVPTAAEDADRYTKPVEAQPLLLVALVLLGLGVVAAAVPWPWPRALAESGFALGGLLFLAGGEVLARRAADARVTADAAIVGGSTPGGPPSFASGVSIEPHVGIGFALAGSLLVALAALSLTRLVRLSATVPGAPDPLRPEQALSPPAS